MATAHRDSLFDAHGHFGSRGGMLVSETVITALHGFSDEWVGANDGEEAGLRGLRNRKTRRMKPSPPPAAVSRRDFLKKGAAGTSLFMLGLSGAAAEETKDPEDGGSLLGPDSSWESVRDQFDLDDSLIHMTGLLLASHPRPVREAIERYRQALDRNPPVALQQYGDREHAGREAAARYLQTYAGDIALTDSTTMGLGLLYGGLRIREDQEILSTLHDHSSTSAALDYKAAATGCTVKRIALFEKSAEADADQIVQRISEAIHDKTRVLAVTHVHSSSGVKLPLTAIGQAVAEVNRGRSADERLLFCVDGVHAFGVENLEAGSLGCDFFVAGCHKWLFGPRGTGIVWGRRDLWGQVAPIIPTFSGRSSPGRLMTPGGFHSFEHRWALSEAFEFHLQIGKARVEERIHLLNSLLKDELATIERVTLHTPRSSAMSSGITCFEIAGVANREVVRRLAERRITASTTPYAVSYARLTPGLLNNETDLEATVAAVRAIAAL